MPAGLWTAHVYWAAILLVLLSRGAGADFRSTTSSGSLLAGRITALKKR